MAKREGSENRRVFALTDLEKKGKKLFENSEKIVPFENKVWLSSPTMHGEELEYMKAAYDTNWMSTVGENINELERLAGDHMGGMHAVALSCGTAALHLAVKLAAGKLYGSSSGISTPDGLGDRKSVV